MTCCTYFILCLCFLIALYLFSCTNSKETSQSSLSWFENKNMDKLAFGMI